MLDYGVQEYLDLLLRYSIKVNLLKILNLLKWTLPNFQEFVCHQNTLKNTIQILSEIEWKDRCLLGVVVLCLSYGKVTA